MAKKRVVPKHYQHTDYYMQKKLRRLETALRNHQMAMHAIHNRQLKIDKFTRAKAKKREQAVEDLCIGHPVTNFELLKYAIETLTFHIDMYFEHPEMLPGNLSVQSFYAALRCGFNVKQSGEVT